MPLRVSRRIAASLIEGASTAWAQPCSSATRPLRAPCGGNTAGSCAGGGPAGAAARGAASRRARSSPTGARAAARTAAADRRRPTQRSAEPAADTGSTLASSARRQPVGQRPAICLLDMRAGVIDQMHVVHARRAGGHAGEARKAAVDVLDDLARRRPVVLQHVLDQVDAPARRIELVAEQHIGRAGRGAEAAMHAGAQDLVGFRDVRIGELREGEGGLHRIFDAIRGFVIRIWRRRHAAR